MLKQTDISCSICFNMQFNYIFSVVDIEFKDYL